MGDDELTALICELLAEIPDCAWRPNGPKYTADEVGIFYGAIDPSPPRAVGVRVYQATDDADEHWAARFVQIRTRGCQNDRSGADSLAGAAFRVLQKISRVGGISGIRRVSMAPLGADSSGREERTDNYIINLDNQEA